MLFSSLLLASAAVGQEPCEEVVARRWAGTDLADLHDGDEKSLSIKRHTMHITPHNSNQTWEVTARLDSNLCTANVDFDVPGKDDHPPVPLQVELLHMNAYSGRQPGGVAKMAAEFTDPSGTLKKPGYPLNHWVVVGKTFDEELRPCPSTLDAVYADMHDGDEKKISLSNGKMKITSNNESEKWIVHADLDMDLCKAMIDFNVPGKPSPPPVNLTATLWQTTVLNDLTYSSTKTVFEFTDPSGTLADATYPLNHWVQLNAGDDPYVPPVATGKCCYGFPGADNWGGCQSATACPVNPSCETPELCEGICRGTWCNTAAENVEV